MVHPKPSGSRSTPLADPPRAGDWSWVPAEPDRSGAVREARRPWSAAGTSGGLAASLTRRAFALGLGLTFGLLASLAMPVAHAQPAAPARTVDGVPSTTSAGTTQAALPVLPVLCWHDVVAGGAAAAVTGDSTTIGRADLVAQFELLRALGYTPISLSQWLAGRDNPALLPPRPVLLTFDDGLASVYDVVFPLLRLYGFPAVVAVVDGWQDHPKAAPEGRRLATWAQLREMQQSGLVEIASHSHDLHHGVVANPQGNVQPAATTLIAVPSPEGAQIADYEAPAAQFKRLVSDLRQSSDRIAAALGQRPRALVWPFGANHGPGLQAAQEAGFAVTLGLDPGSNRTADSPLSMSRTLVESTMSLADVVRVLRNPGRDDSEGRTLASAIGTIRALALSIESLDGPDGDEENRRLSELLDRSRRLGVNMIVVDALADDAQGRLDAAWFPNRQLPMRADLLNRVAWQMRTRVDVKVLVSVPLHRLAERLGGAAAKPDAVAELVEDLVRLVPMAGIVFDTGEDLPSNDGKTTESPAMAALLATVRARVRALQPGLMQVLRRSVRETATGQDDDSASRLRWQTALGDWDLLLVSVPANLLRSNADAVATVSAQLSKAGDVANHVVVLARTVAIDDTQVNRRPSDEGLPIPGTEAEPIRSVVLMAPSTVGHAALDRLLDNGVRHVGLIWSATPAAPPDRQAIEAWRPRLSTATRFVPRD